jgi:hypothetical protein
LNLDRINKEFEEVHDSISSTSLARKLPGITRLPIVWWFFKKDLTMKVKWVESKLNMIFSAYDENYESLLKSGKMYTQHIQSLHTKIDTLQEHFNSIDPQTNNEKLYKNGIQSLIMALTWTKTRMTMMLDAANEIRIQMKQNRPLFKTLMESLIIEKSWEIGLKSAQNAVNTMWNFIQKMASEMTTESIKFSKEINKGRFDVLSTKQFHDDLKKLEAWIKEIVLIKNQAILKYEQENKLLLSWNESTVTEESKNVRVVTTKRKTSSSKKKAPKKSG